MALRDKVEALAEGRWLYPVSALLGFLETSIVLVPIEPLLIPLMAGRGNRIWGIAAALLVGNLISAALVYWAAAALAAHAIEPLIAMTNGDAAYAEALDRVRTRGFIGLVLIDLTPIPFQISMAAAGAAAFPFGPFLAAVSISRGVRHFAVGALIWLIGLRAQHWMERHRRDIFIASLGVFALLTTLMFVG